MADHTRVYPYSLPKLHQNNGKLIRKYKFTRRKKMGEETPTDETHDAFYKMARKEPW